MDSTTATAFNYDLALASSSSDLDLQLGQADQACKECRRRKSKCDKSIPICNLCIKYRRHCLYEKHSRTPLTRKHLTEVEEKLERAEALLRQMRQLLPAQRMPGRTSACTAHTSGDQTLRKSSAVPPVTQPHQFDFVNLDHQVPGSSNVAHNQDQITSPRSANCLGTEARRNGLANLVPSPPTKETYRPQGNPLEAPPSTDDFEWDEQETVAHPSPPNFSNETDEGPPVLLDGMASLTVDDKEAGYLGVASGAALLRIIEPANKRHQHRQPSRLCTSVSSSSYPLTIQPNPNRHITDTMIDGYFRQYHLSYPIIHEPTFRAQYSEVIARPNGDSWLVLAYVVAAIGVYSSSTTVEDNLDMELFAQARSILSFKFLEMGNLTLVQALTLISNYQQKRDRPNSGYNYLGLAVRMAMGLGLHKEFQGWSISPLNMEIRRRVWWSLCVFDVGATITFSRPMVWPYDGVEVSLPLNVTDRELTAVSKTYPPESSELTPYTAVRVQASFHTSTAPIYTRVISKPLPSAEELVQLEREHLEPWLQSIPPFFIETAHVPPRYAFAHAVMQWRYRNLRIIMYRPIVIRRALHARQGRRRDHPSPESHEAYERCLADAKFTIESISEYWVGNGHNRLGAWYALYFLFQSALIPCICLRNEPSAPHAPDWRAQIELTLHTIDALAPVNPSAARSHQIIVDVCGQFLDPVVVQRIPSNIMGQSPHQRLDNARQRHCQTEAGFYQANGNNDNTCRNTDLTEAEMHENHDPCIGPTAESPQTQINNVFSMMWPNVAPLEAADLVMGDDAWMEFLRADGESGGGNGDGDCVWFE